MATNSRKKSGAKATSAEVGGITLLSSADAHVDRKGSLEEGSNRIDELVDIANEHEVDVLTFAGDTFDTGRPSSEAVGRVYDAFNRLETAVVVMQDGNHEQSSVTGDHRTPTEVYFQDHPKVFAASSRAEVIDYKGFGICLLPWMRVAARNRAEDVQGEIEREIERMFNEVDGMPSIFLSHLTVDEAGFNSGLRGTELHSLTEAVEAMVPVSLLDSGPTALNRLGHIHKRQQISDKTGYEGSTYKSEFGEQNKFASLIHISNNNEATLEEIPLSGRSMFQINLDEMPKDEIVNTIRTSNPNDKFRFLTDVDGAPLWLRDEIDWMKDDLGISPEVHSARKPRSEAVMRMSNEALRTLSPIEALREYMNLQGVKSKTARDSIEAGFSEIVSR